ncbi:type 1 glutamine amidotransferase [Jannaschia sp. 2305UL9-9]|uniref:type 1 glutamine amidotransferase n=1 Tax=Jannaschia sp. 2305UL9-9 TaxID=3121638 RepID=UPI0035275B61
MHIGILQAGHPPEPIIQTRGDFDVMFSRLLDGHGFTFSAWDVEHMMFPPSVDAADGWLITGSRHGAYEDHPFIQPLEAFVRAARDADKPMVGICFGHQIIAQALGGVVAKFDGGWGLGNHTYETTEGAAIALNAWHQDQVVTLPATAKVLARNAFCENAIVAYGQTAFTIQAHPEFDNALLADYVSARRGTGTYPDALMDAAIAATDRPIDDTVMAHSIAQFFKTRVAHV